MYIVRPSSDDAYFPVPHGKQILHHIIAALFLFNHHRRNPVSIRIGICQHHRHGKILREKMNDPRMPRHINHPVHFNGTQLLQRRLQHGTVGFLVIVPGFLPPRIQTKVLHDCPISLFFTAGHNAFYHSGRTELGNIFRYNSYRFCLLVSQPLSDIIRLIPSFLHHIPGL